jgi:heme/copper-type cytochrome/quinol oxidase subunit 2
MEFNYDISLLVANTAMNADVFYITIAVAIGAIGLLAFLVGGTAMRARIAKQTGDEQGYNTTQKDLVRWSLAAVIIAITAILSVASGVLSVTVMMPAQIVADPTNFFALIGIAAGGAAILGFGAGVGLMEDRAGKKQTRPMGRLVGSIVAVAGVSFITTLVGIGARVAATNSTVDLTPLAEMLEQMGTTIIPAVIIVVIALIPVILLLIGVKFAGGFLTEILEMFREMTRFGK